MGRLTARNMANCVMAADGKAGCSVTAPTSTSFAVAVLLLGWWLVLEVRSSCHRTDTQKLGQTSLVTTVQVLLSDWVQLQWGARLLQVMPSLTVA